MKIYDVSRLPSSITLGWDGENNWRPIAFDCSALLTGRPDAVVTLWLLPKGAAQAFPVALERDGNTVTWTPLNEEMTAERGQLQIVVQDGTDVGKSKVIDYTVRDSLVGGADHPAETPSWAVQVVADVTEQADRAEEAAESIGESIGEQLPGAIAEYLEEHPVTVTETDPTVPAWAKTPQKPTYTAEDVGALPDSYTPPVTSVNGRTGAVALTASDVHALPDSTVIPEAVTEQDVAGWGFTKNTGTYSKPSGGIPASDLASAVQTSLGKADTALQSHQSLAAYRTASAQDAIDNAQNVEIGKKANTTDLAEVAFSGDYNDLLNRPDEDYIFADEIPQNADHSAKYVLPDGYIYVYGEHTYHRVYNVATGGLLNKVPVQNQNVETTGDKAGAFLSAPIPWDSSWTQYEKAPTVVRITGSKTLLPIWYNSAIQVFYYKANGDFKFSLGQSAIHSFVGGPPASGASISLPCEFNLADNNFYPLEGTGYVRIYLGISSDGAITAEDVADLVINVPFYDSDVTATEWYNSGERYTTDPQVEQNTEDIAALDTRVTALEEDSGSGGGISVHTNQVLYAVGDSITRGAVAGGEDYAWPKHVIDINGYDATNSVNLGQNGLGFDTAATGSGDTVKAIVDRTDFSAADIVTVALGCNDWSNSNALLTNIWSNMEYCFNKIRTDNPYCKLFYILPFNMSFLGSFSTFYCLSAKGDNNPLCPYSYTLMEYINMIKDKLAEPTFQAFRINVIDMVECPAINRQNITTALADQVHPTASTQEELGKEIARRIVLADGAQGEEPGYQTAQQVQTAIAGKADKIPRIAKASTDTTATIEPNKLYVWPEMASLTITLAAITDNTIVNEYHFIFESGSTATTTTFPAIPGLDDFAAEADTVYEVSILEGRALVTSWEVTA